jgi:hypothetical protein
MSRALPSTPWGPSRLDAVGMIFNRLTGLDIGTGPDRVIPDNIRGADAPVRYPFLWNSPTQDFTQGPASPRTAAISWRSPAMWAKSMARSGFTSPRRYHREERMAGTGVSFPLIRV